MHTYTALAAASLGLAFVVRQLLRRFNSNLPPGPTSYPLVGNLLSIPKKYPWKDLAKASERYGDVVYYHGLGNSILILNSLESMVDLLAKKGNTYCSRPHLVVASELMDLTNSMAFIPFGDRWKLHRKFARAALNPEAVKGYERILADISGLLNESLKKDPVHFIDHVRLGAGRVIMSTIYGITVDSPDDPHISIAEAAMVTISRAVLPGAFLVDLIPALKYLPSWAPFTGWRDYGLYGRGLVAELVKTPFEYVKREMSAGTAQMSFTLDVLTKEELQYERDNDVDFEKTLKWSAASMYAAGLEVISCTIVNMIMAMALHPEKLKLAHAEMDKVLGGAMPTVHDREMLPYTDAVVKETLRWHPPLPMDIARSSIEDDVYRGYFIPEKTTVFPNVWAIAYAHDAEFPPESFIPERFLRENPTLDPSVYCFGFGRRNCPAKMLAENAIWILAAYVIKGFDIAPALDKTGKPIPVHVQYSSGLVSLPEPFQCTITPRS